MYGLEAKLCPQRIPWVIGAADSANSRTLTIIAISKSWDANGFGLHRQRQAVSLKPSMKEMVSIAA